MFILLGLIWLGNVWFLFICIEETHDRNKVPVTAYYLNIMYSYIEYKINYNIYTA